MTFKQVNEVPNFGRCAKHDLKGMLREFMESDKRIVEILFTEREYKSPAVARCCIYRAVVQHKIPVKVHMRSGHIYLARM